MSTFTWRNNIFELGGKMSYKLPYQRIQEQMELLRMNQTDLLIQLQLEDRVNKWDKSELSRYYNGKDRLVPWGKHEVMAKILKMKPEELRGVQMGDGTFFMIDDGRELRKGREKFLNEKLLLMDILYRNGIIPVPSPTGGGRILFDGLCFLCNDEQLTDILNDIELEKKHKNDTQLDGFICKYVKAFIKSNFMEYEKPPSD